MDMVIHTPNRRTILILLLLTAVGWACQDPKSIPADPEETAIRVVRDLSNQAIAKHDTTALASAWTTDYHVITSRNAEVSGRAANIVSYGHNFSERPDVIYVRTPDHIRVFSQWNMASESGSWVGRWTEPGTSPEEKGEQIVLGGSYFAKWHKVDGKWLIRAEIFVPLTCSGEKYCSRVPI